MTKKYWLAFAVVYLLMVHVLGGAIYADYAFAFGNLLVAAIIGGLVIYRAKSPFGVRVGHLAQFAIAFIFVSLLASQAAAFEANISTEEVRRLNNEFLLKDLAVGETMFVARYDICAVGGKFVVSGLTGSHDPSDEYSKDDAYYKVKRLPKFEVSIEIMPPIDGTPMKERDYIFDKACGEGFNWFMSGLSVKELIENPFAITTINGFTDAKSLWQSFEQSN